MDTELQIANVEKNQQVFGTRKFVLFVLHLMYCRIRHIISLGIIVRN